MPRLTPTERLRRELKEAAESLPMIAQATGVDKSVLFRFREGGPIKSPTFDRLCAHFKLRLVRK